MSDTSPLYIDATMLYRWRHLAPVGIVRLERLLASHLRFRSALGTAQYVLWDGGYRLADGIETELLDALLSDSRTEARGQRGAASDTVGTPAGESSTRRVVPMLRRGGLRVLGSLPDHLRPFAEQAGWSAATLAVESVRYVRRGRIERDRSRGRTNDYRHRVEHQVDFSGGCDLVALGLGWEYLDHEAMYMLKCEHGVRIHMPAFDLIPVFMPHMNAGQSDLVHRYYAEMAHYADTITSISEATANALEHFYLEEGLPTPYLAINTLPGSELVRPEPSDDHRTRRRHRLEGESYILSVSTIEVRKNHLLLAKVWAECISEGIDIPRLLIVGRMGWDVNELFQWVAHAPELRDRVTFASDVEDDELVHLYEDSLFTVFPSRIEGWGLPITESLTYGKVCLHSTDPAQFEASQGLMPALHPDDFVGWKREIIRLTTDSAHRDALERSIRERYVRRTPQQYCEQFEGILASRRLTK